MKSPDRVFCLNPMTLFRLKALFFTGIVGFGEYASGLEATLGQKSG